MAACCAGESETTIIGFKFTKKPRMRVIAPTVFSFSVSPDFYYYIDVDEDDDGESGSDVKMIGVVDSDMDDHQISSTPRHLHVHEASMEYDHLPHQFDDHDDDDQFYSAQTDFISSPSLSTASSSSDPTSTSPSSSSPVYTPSSPDHYTPLPVYTPSSPDHYTPSSPDHYTPSTPDYYTPSSPLYAPSY